MRASDDELVRMYIRVMTAPEQCHLGLTVRSGFENEVGYD